MPQYYLTTLIILNVLSFLIGVVGSIAANQIPAAWQPYLWLAWPVWGLLLVAIIIVLIWQQRVMPAYTGTEPVVDRASRPTGPSPAKFLVTLVAVILIVFLTLAFGLGWFFSRGSFDSVLVNFYRLSAEQFFTLALLFLIFAFILMLSPPIFVSFVYMLQTKDSKDRAEDIKQETESKAKKPDSREVPHRVHSAPETARPEPILQPVTSTIPAAGSWLKPHGFVHDPFAFDQAESIPEEVLDEVINATYVESRQFDRHIERDLDRSLIILDPWGSGKTFARLRLQTKLQPNSGNETTGQSPAGLVVPYTRFGQSLLDKLPNIGLQDHTQPLLVAIAEALCGYIVKRPDKFLKADDRVRTWTWAYVTDHLPDRFETMLRQSYSFEQLYKDWHAHCTHSASPSRWPTEDLDAILADLTEWIAALGLSRLFILIDGIDGYPQTINNYEKQGALINPILNTGDLLANPKISWKLFLSNAIKDAVDNSFGRKTGRIEVIPIDWDEERLLEQLQLRLEWASAGVIQKITMLFDEYDLPTEVDIDRELARIALRHTYLGPPRFLLKLGRQLLDRLSDEDNTRLMYEDWLTVKAENKPDLLPMIEILHSDQNKSWGERLRRSLQAQTKQCWIGCQPVEPAGLHDYLRGLIYELDEGDSVLLTLSEPYLSLFQVEEDLAAYIYLLQEICKKNAQIIFVRQTDVTLPGSLINNFQVIDFYQNYNTGLAQLLDRACQAVESVSQAEPRTRSGIYATLKHALEEILLRCGPFDSDRVLRSVFVDRRLIQWQNDLPEAGSTEERVRLVTDYLYRKRNNNGLNGLALFLQVIGEGIDSADDCRRRVLELADIIAKNDQ